MENLLTLEQKQVLSQNQIQSLEILAMDTVTLNEFMQNEYLENPILEYQASPLSDEGGAAAGQQSSADTNRESPEDLNGWETMANLRQYKALAEASIVYSGGSQPDDDEHSVAIPDRVAPSIRDYVLNQLPSGHYSDQEMELMGYMTELLDQSGFFTMSAEETADMARVPVEMVEKCLDQLRQLEPYGIFASGLKDCLLRQLEQQGLEGGVMWRMVEDHLEDIAEGRLSSITRDLKISTAEARHYIFMIRKLNPRPLAGLTGDQAQYVVPDIILSCVRGHWEITLNDSWIGDYHISDYYLTMMESTQDPELKEYFCKKLERARLILRNIEQRRSTMMNITRAVVEWQADYFAGQGPLKPMTMADIADEINMHTSTVSRGIRGKYIQSPRETILFKDLFSQAVLPAGGSGDDAGMTADQIKARIRELVASEDHDRPYSDQALAKLLEDEGISISRRTVAKYREEMHIAGSFQRKI